MVEPIILKDALSEVEFKTIQNRFFDYKVGRVSDEDVDCEVDDEMFQRIGYYNDPLFKEMHEKLCSVVETWCGEKVRPSYRYSSIYFIGQGKCPLHVDRPQCVYTVDLCVNQGHPWAINIEGKDYLLNIGESILFCGASQKHSRPPMAPDNFCDMLFFHFVPVGFKGELD